jgi:hypothetical protein
LFDAGPWGGHGIWTGTADLITSSPHRIGVGRTYSSNRENGATGAFFSSGFVTIVHQDDIFYARYEVQKDLQDFSDMSVGFNPNPGEKKRR